MFVKEEVVRDLFKNLFVDAQSPPSALHLEEYQQQKDEKTVSSFDALLQQRRSQRQTLRHQQLKSYTTPWTSQYVPAADFPSSQFWVSMKSVT